MSVVIDANIIAALALPLPYSDQAKQKIATWQQFGTELYAPLLFEYEITTILRRSVVSGLIDQAEAVGIVYHILNLDIGRLFPDVGIHHRAMNWAERLGQAKTYDSYYLAAAEHIGAEFWTADRRLVNGARQAGAGWVNWIGDAE